MYVSPNAVKLASVSLFTEFEIIGQKKLTLINVDLNGINCTSKWNQLQHYSILFFKIVKAVICT